MMIPAELFVPALFTIGAVSAVTATQAGLAAYEDRWLAACLWSAPPSFLIAMGLSLTVPVPDAVVAPPVDPPACYEVARYYYPPIKRVGP